MIAPSSRYAGLDIATVSLDGRDVRYLRRRFLPDPDGLFSLARHVVVDGDRLDNLAARYFADPEQFWQIADANAAVRPEELCTVGRVLRITLPQGLGGAARV